MLGQAYSDQKIKSLTHELEVWEEVAINTDFEDAIAH